MEAIKKNDKALNVVIEKLSEICGRSTKSLPCLKVPLVVESADEQESSHVRPSADTPDLVSGAASDQVYTSPTPSSAAGKSSVIAASIAASTTIKESTVFFCDECDYQSQNKYYLKQHIDLVHNSKRPYQCPFCDYAGKRSYALKEHLIVHSSERPYECTHCNATFRKKGHLTNHIKMHASQLFCTICQAVCKGKQDLLDHLHRQHSSVGTHVFACDQCLYATYSNEDMLKHMEEHFEQTFSEPTSNSREHELAVTVPMMMKCSECGFTTPTKDAMQKHMLDQHIDSLTGATISARKMQMSKPTSGVGYADLVAVASYCCSTCRFSSTDEQSMSRHMATHATDTPAKLPASSLAPPPPPLVGASGAVAPDASAKFSYNAALSTFSCTICGYTCDQQRTIKSHIWKHSGHKDILYPMFQNGPVSQLGESAQLLTNQMSYNSAVLHQDKLTTSNTDVTRCESTQAVITLIAAEEIADDFDNQPRLDSPASETTILEFMNPISQLRAAQTPDVVESVNHVVSTDSPQAMVYDYMESHFADAGPEYVVDHVHVQDVADEVNGVRVAAKRQRSASDSEIGKMKRGRPGCSRDANPYQARAKKQIDARASPGPVEIISETNLFTGSEIEVTDPEKGVTIETRIRSLAGKMQAELQSDAESQENISPAAESQSPRMQLRSSKRQSGICSSLLAVIEQLRERSGNEAEIAATELELESDGAKVVVRPGQKRAPKPKRTILLDDNLPLMNENVERLDDGTYRCTLCHYRSQHANLMKQHMRMHKSKKPFECSLCDFIATNSETLQDHMLQHCKVRTYQCKVCGTAFNYKSQLRAHQRAHNESEPFSCNVCTYETMNPLSFRNHLRIHSQTDPVDNGASCSTCNGEFSSTCEKNGHTRLDSKPCVYVCDECDFSVEDHTKLNEHIQTKHSSIQMKSARPKEDSQMQCSLCDFTAISVRSLKSHMKRHINDQRYVEQPLEQYKCSLCGYVCHHLPSLKSHMWRHASETNYSYQQSNDVINAVIDYETLKKDAGVNAANFESFITFRCCQCGFESTDRAKLSAHMKDHKDVIAKTLEV